MSLPKHLEAKGDEVAAMGQSVRTLFGEAKYNEALQARAQASCTASIEKSYREYWQFLLGELVELHSWLGGLERAGLDQ
eukprot:5105701-Pleurochrysis_carterae.AAC.1